MRYEWCAHRQIAQNILYNDKALGGCIPLRYYFHLKSFVLLNVVQINTVVAVIQKHFVEQINDDIADILNGLYRTN